MGPNFGKTINKLEESCNTHVFTFNIITIIVRIIVCHNDPRKS